jgi:L-fuconolactonase|tara:strand:+ start:2776 stop:2943 length:168 start_codon:yes stop_codon:yes gene_type:complete
MIIDSHYHFRKNSAVWDAWIEQSMSVIRKDFLPTDLESLFKEYGVDAKNLWLKSK